MHAQHEIPNKNSVHMIFLTHYVKYDVQKHWKRLAAENLRKNSKKKPNELFGLDS